MEPQRAQVDEKLYTILLLATASGEPHRMVGQYVVSYDPEVHRADGGYDGGLLLSTSDQAKAGRFEFKAAHTLWKSGPTCACHRTRADGKPNRPLTAFHVQLERCREGGEDAAKS